MARVLLFARIQEPRRWTYLFAFIPFFVSAIFGWEDGAAVPYLITGLICAAQFFFPTVAAWWIFFLCYLSATLCYVYVCLVDFLHVSHGARAHILVNVVDIGIYIAWVSLLGVTTWLFWRMRVARLQRIGS